jgi:1-acyl-sn-glycerol-3-phosphate acyltransferase
VVFFPEGTTSNGKALLKFHSGLLGQALTAKARITAAFLRYTLTEKNDPGMTVEDDVCWGEKPLLAHIFGFLGLHGVHAEVTFADRPIAFSSDGMHRKKASLEAQAAVASLGGGVPVVQADDALPGADLVRE